MDLEIVDREVYETADVPEVLGEEPAPPEYESEFISADPLSPTAARATFDRTQVDGTADFSASKPVGWTIRPRYESRNEKISRIRREIEELRLTPDGNDEEDLLDSLDDATNRRVMSPNSGRVTTQISLESIDKLSKLESRLSTIEQRVGPLTSNNLCAQLDILSDKINAICASPEELEKTVQRLQPLIDQAAKLEGSVTSTQINELYGALRTINDLSPTLDLVVARMRELQVIHQDAANVHNNLTEMQSLVQRRQVEIDEWKSMLKRIEEQVATTTETMNGNIEVVKKLANAK